MKQVKINEFNIGFERYTALLLNQLDGSFECGLFILLKQNETRAWN